MFIKFSHILFLTLTIFVGFGFVFTSSGVDPSDYIQVYQSKNNLLHKEKNVGQINYSVSYLTKEIQVIQAIKRGAVNELEAQNWLSSKENEISLLFEIEVPSNGNQEFLKFQSDSSTYEQRVKYFSFGFKSDIALIVDGHDTIATNEYHFERNFGISPKGTITISAVIPKNHQKLEILFNDKIYGNGQQSIEFDLKQISTLPKLKTIKKWKNQNG